MKRTPLRRKSELKRKAPIPRSTEQMKRLNPLKAREWTPPGPSELFDRSRTRKGGKPRKKGITETPEGQAVVRAVRHRADDLCEIRAVCE